VNILAHNTQQAHRHPELGQGHSLIGTLTAQQLMAFLDLRRITRIG